MSRIALPHDAKAGPTKPEVRSVLLGKLRLGPTDHFVEVGSCTGAVTVEAARRAGRVTAVERKSDRLDVTRRNLAANGVPVRDGAGANSGGGDADNPVAEGDDADPVADGGTAAAAGAPSGGADPAPVSLVNAEAPDGLPDDADALFVGGSRNYEAVLDRAVEAGVDRVAMNVSRLEVAGDAVRAFRERGLLTEVLQVQVSRGYELAGATSFDSENPVYVLVGGTGDGATDDTPADGAPTDDAPTTAESTGDEGSR